MRIKFSIIVPVFHGGGFLYRMLESLDRLDLPSNQFEVIIVGSAKDEPSHQIVTEQAAHKEYLIKYIRSNEENRSAMLNKGCAVARGQYLLFADDDCVFKFDWLQQISNVLNTENNVGIIGGRDELMGRASSFDLAVDYVLNSLLGTGGIRNNSQKKPGKYYPKLWNMIVPDNVATEVAFEKTEHTWRIFNESLIVHEDVDLANRIEQTGRRIVFAPAVCVGHYRDTTLFSFIKRNFDMARTSRSIGVHRFSHRCLAAFVISVPFLVLWFFLDANVSSTLPMVLLGIYLMTLLMGSVGGVMHTKNIYVCFLVPVLLASLHFARGVGYLFPWEFDSK